jgi:hypothetical protein
LACLCWIMREVGWGVLLVVRSSLHSVVIPGLQIVAEVEWCLGSFSIWCQCRWANLWSCDRFIAMVYVVQGS